MCACVAAALSLLIYGWSYSTNPNTAQIIPFIKKLANPALYPGDFYSASLSAFPSLYPRLMAGLARFFPLEPLHFALYLCVKVWFMWLVYKLAMELFGREDAAAMGCFLTAASPLSNLLALMGEDPLLKTALFQTSFAAPFALLSLIWFLRRKYIPAFILLWVVYFINGLSANFLAALYFAVFIGSKPNRAAMLKAGGVFAALMLVWAVWYMRLSNPFGGAGPEFAGLLKLWYPGHYFPSGWSAEKWRSIAIFLPLLAWFYFDGLKYTALRAEIKAFLIAFAALWLGAAFFAEAVPVRQIIVMQLFRSDSFFAAIGLLFAARALCALAGEGARGTALAGLLLCAFLELTPPLCSPYVFAVFFADRLAPRAAKIAAALLALFAVSGLFMSPQSWGKSIVVLLLAMWYLADAGLKFVLGRRRYALICALALLPFLPGMAQRISGGFEYLDAEDNAWLDAQSWARRHTPESAVFLTPPDRYGFRVFSERAPVVEWLDGAAMHWAPGAEKIWFGRISAVRSAAAAASARKRGAPDAGALSAQDLGYGELDMKGFQDLAGLYRADYCVVHAGKEITGLVPAYENAGFIVYPLKGGARIAAPPNY